MLWPAWPGPPVVSRAAHPPSVTMEGVAQPVTPHDRTLQGLPAVSSTAPAHQAADAAQSDTAPLARPARRRLDGPAPAGGIRDQALAWVQTALLAVCVVAAVAIGVTGPLPLAVAIAGAGAAAAGGLQITIHIRR